MTNTKTRVLLRAAAITIQSYADELRASEAVGDVVTWPDEATRNAYETESAFAAQLSAHADELEHAALARVFDEPVREQPDHFRDATKMIDAHPVADEREAFEAAMAEAGYGNEFKRGHDSQYLHQRDEDRYVGWSLARAAGAAPQPAAVLECGRMPGMSTLREVDVMVSMLESGEWAEHVGKTPLGARLEAAITKLHAGPQPVSGADGLPDAVEHYGTVDDLPQPSGNAGELPQVVLPPRPELSYEDGDIPNWCQVEGDHCAAADVLVYGRACAEAQRATDSAALAAQTSGQAKTGIPVMPADQGVTAQPSGQAQQNADMYWDADDGERFCASDLDDAVEYMMDGYTMSDLPMPLDLQCARSLPNVRVQVTGYSDANGWQYEVIDAARQESKGGGNA